jgi:hypothetical protein
MMMPGCGSASATDRPGGERRKSKRHRQQQVGVADHLVGGDEVLRGQPNASGGDELLDVPLVERDPVRLSDAVHHLDLQRNDRHRRPRLRQQFERAVEQGVVENRPIECRIIAAAAGSVDRRCGGGEATVGDKGIDLTLDRARLRCRGPGSP